MAAIPEVKEPSKTVQAVYAAYEQRHAANRWRSRRLGASILGRPCARSVWMDFRWCNESEFDGRTLRLFETGNLEEIRVATNLAAIGCEVHCVDPATKQQFEFTAASGHVVCKIDAAIVGLPESPKTWHVGEFKTHNAKSFAGVKGKGLKVSEPDHYVQIGIGMKLSGMDRGIYFAVCKDSDELHVERLRWEEIREDIDQAAARAEQIVRAKEPPEKISDDRDSLNCRYCCHKENCHGKAVVDVTCRSCVHAEPVMEEGGTGRWRCAKHDRTLSVGEQGKACEDHLYIPDLVPFAKADDAGCDPTGDWISYRNADGTAWRNGKQRGDYRSLELTQLPAELVGAGMVDACKTELDATVVAGEEF
jgi:hypothetical protein